MRDVRPADPAPGALEPSAGRKRYEKPTVLRVELKPEEAVLGACKNSVTSGPGQGGCSSIAPCASLGS